VRVQERGAVDARVPGGVDHDPLASIARIGDTRRHGRYTIRRILDPGRALSDEQQAALQELVTSVGNEMVGADISEYWARRGGYFEQLSEWWLAECDGQIVGWLGALVIDADPEPLLYIDTCGLVSGHRRRGVASLLYAEAFLRNSIARRRLLTMTLRTQSPVVARATGRLTRFRMFPTMHPGIRQRPNARRRASAAAAATAARLSPDVPFDSDTFVMRGAFSYLGSLYGKEPPSSGDPAIDAWFSEHVDVERGDGLIQAFVFTPWLGALMAAAWLTSVRQLRQKDQG
jgi:GNAT superfamily N-acetyltransferase